MIDLYSDTKTQPCPGMRRAIAEAECGDDMAGEDPTVNRLEALVAEMFGMEAAVFACSGTQSNQMGVRAHCLPGDELLIDASGHIANYEAGAPAVLSGVTVRTLAGRDGMLDVDILHDKVRADNQHLCRTRLVCLENSTNSGGGRTYPLEQAERIGSWAREHGLKVHLDGARFFNACVARSYRPAEFARHVDTVSVCFSKGLGCPMGSVLIGSASDVAHARRSRKIFGGALRQAGIVAAAAIYALEHNVERLAEDHANAQVLARGLAEIDGVDIDSAEVETNLVFFNIARELGTAAQLEAALREQGVRIGASGLQRMRACTHLDVDRDDCLQAVDAVRSCLATLAGPALEPTGPYARA